MQEYKIVKNVLLDFGISNDDIEYHEESNTFITPVCVIDGIDDIWHISFNLSFIDSFQCVTLYTSMVKELMNHQIMVEIDHSYYIVIDDKTGCVHQLYEDEIYKLSIEKNISYKEAKEKLEKNLLSSTVINNNNLN